MNILQLSKYYPPTKGGIELVAESISHAETYNGHKVFVISFGRNEKKYIGKNNERVFQIKKDLYLNSTPCSFYFHKKLLDFVNVNSINKIYIHLPNPYMHHLVYTYSKKLKKMNIRLSAIYHSDLINQKILGPIYNKYLLKTAYIYDEFICSSENFYQTSYILKSMEKEKVKIIPFTVSKPQKFKKRLKFSGKLLSIGRLVPYKGFEFLLKSIKKTNYSLNLIGNGPLLNNLLKLQTSKIKIYYNMEESEKSGLFSECDLFIMSSINNAETYGMTLVESFSAGVPVVAPDLPTGVSYLVEDNKRGRLFKSQNEDSLLSALKSFETDERLLPRCSENAFEFFKEHLSFSVFANHFKNL